MANEAQVRSSLFVKTGNITYQSQPSAFNCDMTGAKGPTPGALTVSTSGTDVSFSELVQPGLVRLMNLDADNYVEWGMRDPQTGAFYYVGELKPGESFVFRFSRNLLEQYDGPGTGTTGPTNTFHMRANTAACNVLVEAFES